MGLFFLKMRGIFSTLYLIHGLATATRLVCHDDSFQPDHILRVTAQDYSHACIERYSVLVNGSSPGPKLHLHEGTVSWIRVYNDLEDLNVTMVRDGFSFANVFTHKWR